jgi:hypothetical protein
MTETKPKRHWFSFSLRTLFVLVTIIGVGAAWVTYQLDWIRDRHKFLQNWGVVVLAEIPKSETAWNFWLFGERQVARLSVPLPLRSSASRLFPEAEIDGNE